MNNFRVTPTTGVFNSDGQLAYAGSDVNNGTTPVLTAAAYINNFAGAGSTALYSLDANLNSLVMNMVGPTFNVLTTVGTLSLTLGGAAIDITSGTTGFDVVTVGGVNTAYVTSNNALYTVDLTTGVLTSLGTQAGSGIIDVAFVPEPGTYAMIAVGGLLFGFMAVRRSRLAA